MRASSDGIAGRCESSSPAVHRDTRGFFLESYRADQLAALGIADTFVQDNHSRSVARTLRGLHWQWRRPQAKLIRVVAGAIFDVVVDIRRGIGHLRTLGRGESFGRRFPPALRAGRIRARLLRAERTADIEYKCTDYYDPAGEGGLRWDDPSVGIDVACVRPYPVAPGRRAPPIRPKSPGFALDHYSTALPAGRFSRISLRAECVAPDTESRN